MNGYGEAEGSQARNACQSCDSIQ